MDRAVDEFPGPKKKMDTRGKGRKRGVAAEQALKDKTKAKRARTSTGTSTPSGAKGSQRGKKKKQSPLQKTHDYIYYEGWKRQKDMPPELVYLSQVPKTLLYETRTRDHVEDVYNKIVQRFAGLKKSPDDLHTEGKLLAMVLQPAMAFLHQCINRRFNHANLHKKKVTDVEFGQFIATLLWVKTKISSKNKGRQIYLHPLNTTNSSENISKRIQRIAALKDTVTSAAQGLLNIKMVSQNFVMLKGPIAKFPKIVKEYSVISALYAERAPRSVVAIAACHCVLEKKAARSKTAGTNGMTEQRL